MKNLLLPILGCTVFSLNAYAEEISAAALYKAKCAHCHGDSGVSFADYIPNINGQKLEYLETQLKEFRNGLRSGATMPIQVRMLTDEEISILSVYISKLGSCNQ